MTYTVAHDATGAVIGLDVSLADGSRVIVRGRVVTVLPAHGRELPVGMQPDGSGGITIILPERPESGGR